MTTRLNRSKLLIFATILIVVIGSGVFIAANYVFNSSDESMTSTPVSQSDAEKITTEVVASNLENPWDIVFLEDDTMVITERSGAISKLVNGEKTQLVTPVDSTPRGEGGVMGLTTYRNEDEEYVYACYSTQNDNRVVRWKVEADIAGLVDEEVIIEGIPVALSGRHSGCQIDFGPDNNLWVGTGDAADESNPQNLNNLGGKVLRVTPTGEPVTRDTSDNTDARIYSYGHRNIQGLAFFDSVRGGSYGYSAEHGPDVDDEINPLQQGNFGWQPGTGYDESVPMTDLDAFPNAIMSTWSSGDRTNAVSGLTILRGEEWGEWENRLLVGALKDRMMLLMEIDGNEVITTERLLENDFGRIRAVVLGPDNAIYISTDNGQDDMIIKLTL